MVRMKCKIIIIFLKPLFQLKHFILLAKKRICEFVFYAKFYFQTGYIYHSEHRQFPNNTSSVQNPFYFIFCKAFLSKRVYVKLKIKLHREIL